jgi:hypothetical protein
MKKFFIAIFLLISLPLVALSWIDTGGSTWATTTGDYDPKDIINMVFDKGPLAIRVVVDSGTITTILSIYETVDTSDTPTHTRLDKLYVLNSTGTDSTLAQLINVVSQINEFKTISSTGTDALLDKLFSILNTSDTSTHTKLDQFKTLSSTGTDALLTQVINILQGQYGLMRSTHGDTMEDKLDWIIAGLKAVVISSGTLQTMTTGSVEVTNFPADYPDATAQSSLASIDGNLEHCDTNDVKITSGTIFTKAFDAVNSTGTVLSVGSGSSTSYTPQSDVVEIFLTPHEDNTDEIRLRFFDENVDTGGTPLPSSTMIIDTWNKTIYFQSESGTQKVIINEIDE